VQLHLLTPEPGTELLNQYRDQIAYDGHISDFNFPALETDDSFIIESNPNVFINHHYFPSSLPRRRHVFVTTAYQELYSLGFPVLRYILTRHSGNLHRLIEALNEWSVATGRPATCDSKTIEEFFRETVGPTHHLFGLVRYMLAAAELRRRASLDPTLDRPPATFTEATQYRLSNRSIVLRNVPDCPAILNALRDSDGGLVPPRFLRKRFNFLLYLPSGAEEMLHNFELTEASTSLMEHLAAACSWPDGQTTFELETGYPAPPADFLHALADRGFLEVITHVSAV
jgi:hypothetical protein